MLASPIGVSGPDIHDRDTVDEHGECGADIPAFLESRQKGIANIGESRVDIPLQFKLNSSFPRASTGRKHSS
jgi:hypothetical protein